MSNRLSLFSTSFIRINCLGIVDLVIDVPFECHLNAYVPWLYLNFEAGVKKEIKDAIDLNFIESIGMLAVTNARSMNAYHSKAPCRDVLVFYVENDSANIKHFVPIGVLGKLRQNCFPYIEKHCSCIDWQRKYKNCQLSCCWLDGSWNFLIITFSVYIVFEVAKLKTGPYQWGREEKHESYVSQGIWQVYYFSFLGILS